MLASIIIYLCKVSLSIAAFYLLHILFFRKETFFRLRRAYFLLALSFSALVPFISFDSLISSHSTIGIISYELEEVIVTASDTGASDGSSLSLWSVLMIVYLAATTLFGLRFVVQLLSLRVMLNKRRVTSNYKGCRLIEVKDDDTPTFSFFRWIIINTKAVDENVKKDMVMHEMVHAQEYHSVDVVLYELLCIALWWNPFVWLMRAEMKLNLEFLVDERIKQEKKDLKEYQYSLLNQIARKNMGASPINNFNVLQLKKRIAMMNKKKTSTINVLKYLMVIPIGLVLILSNGTAKAEALVAETIVETSEIETPLVLSVEQDKKAQVYETVENMPIFSTGSKAMMEFLQNNLTFPEKSKKDGINGRVMVRFIVSETGKVEDVRVVKSLNEECDAEALRVIRSMPDWTPGKQNGKNVPVYFTLPVFFRADKK